MKKSNFVLGFSILVLLVSSTSTFITFHIVKTFLERMENQEPAQVTHERRDVIVANYEMMAENISAISSDQGMVVTINKNLFGGKEYDDFEIICYDSSFMAYPIKPLKKNKKYVSFLVPSEFGKYFNIGILDKEGWHYLMLQ